MTGSMTTAEKIYDALMRLPYVAFQLFFLVRELTGMRTLIAYHPYAGGDWPFVMTMAARVSVVIFLTVLLSFYVSRFARSASIPAGIPRSRRSWAPCSCICYC